MYILQRHEARTPLSPRQESPVGVLLGERGVVFDVGLQLREPPDLSQRVESAVDRDPMSPRSELRITPIAWERPEDLHPDLLRDVRGQLRIPAKPAYDRVDVRRMLRPKPLHGPLVAGYRALEIELIEWHLGQFLSHIPSIESFLLNGDLRSGESFATVRLHHTAEQQSKPGRVGTLALAEGIN